MGIANRETANREPANRELAGQTAHAVLVQGSHDEHARQSYIADLRMHILGDIGLGMGRVYENRVKPAFEKRAGRPPADETEIRKAMLADNYGQVWSSMIRTCQEMIWDSVIPSVERAQPDLNARINAVQARHGSLALDPSVKVPRYLSACDIHLMPGNYHTEWTAGDASQAALFDRGLYVYQAGNAGPLCDGNGRTIAEAMRHRWPDFAPTRILDVGCTVGNNTLPYADVFPAAELHAIDVAAPCLRYAHARAEALGKPVHFRQMDAERMGYDDGSFDLVVSCILFHETSRGGLANILRECHRVLKPGGLMLHMEIPRAASLKPFDAFYMDWDALYNNEPFMQTWAHTDMAQACAAAGFAPETYVNLVVPDYYAAGEQAFADAIRAAIDKPDGSARWGETIHWHLYGARKT
ncbi:MAG: class I SAM-dependent methyltransferase [Rhodospirillaceae bacterium]|nr:class I SAM-dependent methyltransferase [Rhodospirillaceae bacterium]